MRLLIIEDHNHLRKSLSKGFKENGYSVDQTGDGAEGLWYAENNDYDVIILDLMLPSIDGWTILEKLRQQNKAVQILILSARDSVDDRVKGLDHGADDYLTKPFSFHELQARIRSLIRRSYVKKNPCLDIGDLKIDTVRREVSVKGKRIELTPREYALLEYLAFRKGEVVTRTEIWNHVYDFNADNTSNVVDVYIRRLRNKLDSPGSQKHIHTRRGMGYVLKSAKRMNR